MRRLILTAAVALVAGSAGASSIEPIVSGAAVNHSITTVACTSCPPLIDHSKSSDYDVAVIKPGTQKVEIKSIDGEMKMVRTEAWLGGSPVVFISKASEEDIRAAGLKTDEVPAVSHETVASTTPDGVTMPVIAADEAAKSTVLAITAAAPETQSQEFDPSKFDLRLN